MLSVCFILPDFLTLAHLTICTDVPGYEPLPQVGGNKYSLDTDPIAARAVESSTVVPEYPVHAMEPTFMPEEDLKPSATPIAQTQPHPDDTPKFDGIDRDVQMMYARSVEQPPEDLANEWHSHVAHSLGNEGLYSFHARSVEPEYADIEQVHNFRHARSAEAYPEEESERGLYEWINHEPSHEEAGLHARSLQEDDEFTAHYHELAARANAQSYGQAHQDFALDARSLQDDEFMAHYHELAARANAESYGQAHEWDVSGDSEEGTAKYNFDHSKQPVAGDFDELSYYPTYPGEDDYKYHFADFEPSALHASEIQSQTHVSASDVQSQAQVSVDPSNTTSSAVPAAAPTPGPTSAETMTNATPTTALQWSDVASETATGTSSWSASIQARTVSSHFRFRHHSTHKSLPTTPASSSATSRRGFFNLPW
jgi:cell division septation protein DedD